MTNKLQPCRFYFGDDPTFAGFTDGTTWNGFDNVWVTAETHAAIVAHFREGYAGIGYRGADLDEAMQPFTELTPDSDGLYSYACGFATSIDEDDWHIRNR